MITIHSSARTLKSLFAISILALCSFTLADAGERRGFVNQHMQYVALYTQPFGIPASITLAQGILESNCGKSELAYNANNYFGIKGSDKRWTGPTYAKWDDEERKSLFRVYESIEHCYRNYAEFLQQPRYKFLYEIPATDYRAWAYGLKKANYASSATYAEDLIRIIEELGLSKYDRESGEGENTFVLPSQETRPAPPAPQKPQQRPQQPVQFEQPPYVRKFDTYEGVRKKQQRRGDENASSEEAVDAEPSTFEAPPAGDNFAQEAAAEDVQQQENAPAARLSDPTPPPAPTATSPLQRSKAEVQPLSPKSKY